MELGQLSIYPRKLGQINVHTGDSSQVVANFSARVVTRWRVLLSLWLLLCACGSSVTTPAGTALGEAARPTSGPVILTVAAARTTTPTLAPTRRPTPQPLLLPTPTITTKVAQKPKPPTPTPTPAPTAGFVFSETLVITLPRLIVAEPSVQASAVFSQADEIGAFLEMMVETAARSAAPLTPAVPLPLEPTPDGSTRSVQTPILMYHYLSVPPPDANLYRLDLSVPPDLFEQHLIRMQTEGYTTISLYELLAHLTQGAPLPDKPVILTFDDGYRDNYEHAFPLLRQYGMKATFFVVTDFIDEQRPEYLTWGMVRKMYAAGMSIESHGRNHVSLRGKDADYLVWQALGSLETIQAAIGVRPRFVSYPAGEYDQLTIDIFRSANFWAGITTIQGATHESDKLFELRRVRIRGTTTPDELARLLALDW
jgi:peptidoglycan/xylan/chitin deacetylase (PgdA/CDA1 family)